MRGWLLLRNRDYMLFWSGEALSELGSQTSTVAYPLLVLTLTGSAAKAGVVGLAKWLPLAIFAIPAGALADRVDRKRLMIASDAIRMLGAASIVVALWFGRPAFTQVATVAFLDGGLFITSHICERGALPQLVDPALTSRAVTTEAGVAKGILHRHFGDFDAFLAAFVRVGIERLDGQSAELRASTGTRTVEEILVSALTDALAIPPQYRQPRLLPPLAPPAATPDHPHRHPAPGRDDEDDRRLSHRGARPGSHRPHRRRRHTPVMLVGGAHLLTAPDSRAPAGQIENLAATALRSSC
jgi:AcrR family transcriptional regulator